MYEVIQHQRLEANASAITFSAIPQNYTDLLLVHSLRTTLGAVYHFDDTSVRINGDTSTIYTNRLLQSREGSISSGGGSGQNNILAPESTASGSPSGTFGNGQLYFTNYTASSGKLVISEGVTETTSGSTVITMLNSGFYNSNNPITSLSLYSRNSTNFVAGSSATLYGVARKTAFGKMPQGVGGYINYANGHWYHTFTGSGTFVPFNNMQVEYVVVAGGGGSGGGTSGGGGAGGYRSSVQGERSGGGANAESLLSLTANTNYAVVVGAGGAAGLTDGSNGGAGSASSFSTITTVGGGGGDHAGTSQSGGSGGGAGYGTRTAGAATSGQGYPGGNTTGTTNPYYTCGGGGGAGGAGGAVISSYVGGTGGDGVETSITGTPTYLAGGGAGGTGSGTVRGGLGGGGSSIDNQNGVAGTANTGGGAGGPGTNAANSGAAGGSGIVIIRYRG